MSEPDQGDTRHLPRVEGALEESEAGQGHRGVGDEGKRLGRKIVWDQWEKSAAVLVHPTAPVLLTKSG